MNKKIIFLILVGVIIVGMAYFLGTQKSEQNFVLRENTQVEDRNTDQDNVNILVKNFYSALESRNGKLLFSYFTPPTTPEEIKNFTWLTGADLAVKPMYRVFFRQRISNPKLMSTQMVDPSTFVINVSDQLIGIPSAGGETAVYTPRERNVVLTIIKSGDKWLVDKFTDPSNTLPGNASGTPKYSGFAQ